MLKREGRKANMGMKKPLPIGFVGLLVLSMIMVMVPVRAEHPAAAIWVEPAFISLPQCENFTIDVMINITSPTIPGGGTGMFGFEYKLFWDSTVINLTSYTTHIPPGWEPPNGFLVKDETGVWPTGTKAGLSYHWYGYTCLTGPVFTGVMSLGTYNFHVTDLGSSAIDIQDEKLVDDTATQIDHTTEDGYFNNLPTAKLYVHPPKIVKPDLVPSKNFTIDINVLNVINLYSWEFKLYYNNTMLNATSVAEGTFLNQNGNRTTIFLTEINQTGGYLYANCTLEAPPGVTGNGTLATISFHVKAFGESVLDLADTALSDPWGGPHPHYVVDGYFNNVLKARLYVDPPSIIDPTLQPPAQFNVTIKVANVTDLYDYQFKLGYDTVVLNCLSVLVIPFENETSFTTELRVDDKDGLVWVNVTYYPPAKPLTTTDSATLAMIFFQVAAMGSSVLDLNETRLSDPLDGEIPHDVSDGFVSIVERDVAVIDIVLSTDMTYVGRNVYINVTVANEGDMPETFNVSAYYDDTLIDTLPVIDLTEGTNTTLTFTWDTTGTTPCYNYTIKAEASVVPYETDTADNVYIDGKVKIKILGDINGDGIVDIVDVIIAATAFGTVPGDPKWNPDADFNEDGIIDIVDLVIIGVNFGKTC